MHLRSILWAMSQNVNAELKTESMAPWLKGSLVASFMKENSNNTHIFVHLINEHEVMCVQGMETAAGYESFQLCYPGLPTSRELELTYQYGLNPGHEARINYTVSKSIYEVILGLSSLIYFIIYTIQS